MADPHPDPLPEGEGAGRVLVIAGSDSGAGAGIQADLKTVMALGGYATTAITAITAQNTLGVHGIHPIPPAFIQQQIQVILDDIGTDTIKTGMLGPAPAIIAVATTLKHLAQPIVIDPVMVAKGGARLLDDDAIRAMIAHLLPLATLLTPNIPEAEALTGLTIRTEAEAERAIAMLLGMGPKNVLLKGGHLTGPTVQDRLGTQGWIETFEHPRQDTPHTHGTGCTLASAIATGLAQNMSLSAAIRRATDYVAAAIRTAPGLGHGHGPLNHAVDPATIET